MMLTGTTAQPTEAARFPRQSFHIHILSQVAPCGEHWQRVALSERELF